jgi:hypothetical protein
MNYNFHLLIALAVAAAVASAAAAHQNGCVVASANFYTLNTNIRDVLTIMSTYNEDLENGTAIVLSSAPSKAETLPSWFVNNSGKISPAVYNSGNTLSIVPTEFGRAVLEYPRIGQITKANYEQVFVQPDPYPHGIMLRNVVTGYYLAAKGMVVGFGDTQYARLPKESNNELFHIETMQAGYHVDQSGQLWVTKPVELMSECFYW